jgi:hypothetical protein
MSTWKPNEQGIVQIIKLLTDSRTGDTQVQQECTKVCKYFAMMNIIKQFINEYIASNLIISMQMCLILIITWHLFLLQ